MSVQLNVNNNSSDEEKYKILLTQLNALVNLDEPIISNLANIIAALKDSFNKISWVGFYILKETKLYLGPFQGKVACTIIELGKGVCGTSANEKETIIVDNVHEFSGHIACDGGSNSEIVVPLIYKDRLYGVLDLDSYEYSSFSNIDKFYLENLCSLLSNKLNFDKLKDLLID